VAPDLIEKMPAMLAARRAALSVGRRVAAQQIGTSVTSLYLFETGQRIPLQSILQKMINWLQPELEKPR
jgi:hypothetical protein